MGDKYTQMPDGTTVLNPREQFREFKRAYGHSFPVGSYIIMKDGRRLLVGDVNQLGGVCDDCLEEGEVERIENSA